MGILPCKTEERIADFRTAGRHTHITELLRNGAARSEAKELARNSDVNMTMRCNHVGINDETKAVANLPALRGRPARVLSDSGHAGRTQDNSPHLTTDGQSPRSAAVTPC